MTIMTNWMKKGATWIVGIAILIKIGNPLLDYVICGPEPPQPERPSFVENQTDVLGYKEFDFLTADTPSFELKLGITFMLSQSFPKWVVHLVKKFGEGSSTWNDEDTFSAYVNETVDILDARHLTEELKFTETGFMLLTMPEPSKTKDFRSTTDIDHFKEELRPKLMELHPGASRIEFTYNVVRGGNRLGDQPAAVNGPHLDYSQNDTAREEFHTIYPVLEQSVEQLLLLGRKNTETEEVKVLLGIWKPINMKNPVCDHPLAVMDASTFQAEDERPYYLHIDFVGFGLHNLNGANIYKAAQKWYYYSFQKDTEVLIFTQYTHGKHFANPHSSFMNPNCPADFENRISVEMRAAVFYPREANASNNGSSDGDKE